MKALIDADSMIYKAGFGVEEAIDWGDGETTYHGEIEDMKDAIDGMLDSITFATGCDDYELHLTGSGNFRDQVVSDYKHNRKGMRVPEWVAELKQHMIEELGAILHKGWEADDAVVYLKTKYPEDYILCAIDKDVLMQSVGTHYNYGKQKDVTVDEWTALHFKYYQCIAGDPVDGYKGVPGMGPKRAEKSLKDCTNERELWVAALLAYRSKGLRRSNAINTMRLACMHQYDGEGVVLWSPPHRG